MVPFRARRSPHGKVTAWAALEVSDGGVPALGTARPESGRCARRRLQTVAGPLLG